MGRPRYIAWTAVLASAVAAAGCGGSPAPKGPPVRLQSYLAQYPPRRPFAVYFLEWEQRGKALDGTLSFVFPTQADTPTRTQPVAGKADGDAISLEVGTDPPQQWTGEHVGRSIVFHADLGEAGVQKIRFVPASLASFRRTVTKVRAGR